MNMAMFSIRPRAFRSRNPGRDSETDEARFGTISNAIAMALADARRERDGLGQRMNFYYAQAATLMDNSAEYGRRDPVEESAIGSAENNGARARRRMAQLDDQIQRLEDLMAQVDRTLAPKTEPGESVA
jgi:hypothetical protein